MTGEVKNFMSCSPFWMPILLLFASKKFFFQDNIQTSLRNSVTLGLFRLGRFPSKRFTMHSKRNLITLTGMTEGKDVCVFEKMIGTLRVERIFVCSLPKDFKKIKCFGIGSFQGLEPVFVP